MRTKQWIVLAVVLTALVLLMILVVRADPPAQGPELQGAVTGQAGVGTGASTALSTSFTYQGQLESGGEPVNEDCDMAFRLYDGESGGSQVGSAISTTVPVADGLFTVGLDFGGVFTGDARWLAMAVRCPAGSGAYEALSPRQPLSPVPYAMHATTVKQLVHDFVVASGESVSAGDVVAFLDGQVYGPATESAFNMATTDLIAVSALSGTDFVVAYRDEGNSSYGTAVVGTVSGGIVSWGAESVFNKATTYNIAVSALSAADFVVAYRDFGNTDYGTAIVGTVSGGDVSWGTPSAFNEAATNCIAVSALSAADFVVAYADLDHSGYGTARVGTVSDGTVSWGTPSAFNEALTAPIAVSSLSVTDFVVAYGDYGTLLYGMAITGTVGGGDVSWGAESAFNEADTDSIAVSALSATDFVVAYRDFGNTDYGTVRVGTVSGGTMSWGTASAFNEADTDWIAVSSLSATEVVVAYRDKGNSDYGTARVGTVSGGTVIWEKASVFNEAYTSYIAAGSLSDTDFVVAYRDGGNFDYGVARVGHYGHLIGTAKTAASGGETVTVILRGVSDVHSGLVPGEMYYLQADGSLGLAPTNYRVGLAISATELILDQMW